MSDPPRWGEPGYVPPPPPPGWGEPGYVPPPKPPKPTVPLRPGQRRVLWVALALAVLGQLVYWVGILWGTADCYQIFGHPGVAIAGFVISVGAVPLVVPFVRLWSRASLPTFAIVVTLLVAMNPAWEILLMLGGACW
jgi:hypothetical protein